MRLRAKLSIRNDHIIQARKALGLTQLDLSYASGVYINVIQDLESLRYTNAHVKACARRVADFLDIPLEQVLPPELDGKAIPSNIETVREIPSGNLLTASAARMLPAPDQLPEELLEHKELLASLDKAINTMLTERERTIVTLSLGLGKKDKRTHKEIGRQFGISGGRVGVIAAAAIRKLTRAAEIGQIGGPPTDDVSAYKRVFDANRNVGANVIQPRRE